MMSELSKGGLDIDLHSELHADALDTTIHVNVNGCVIDAELLAMEANKAMDILLNQPAEDTDAKTPSK